MRPQVAASAPPYWAFVDRIGPGAVVRLNLSAGDYRTLAGWSAPTPEIRGDIAASALYDGGSRSQFAYDLRLVSVPISIVSVDVDAALKALNIELARKTNILRVQLKDGGPYRYFLTLASPTYDPAARPAEDYRNLVLEVDAQPFILGDPVEQAGISVANNPFTAGNDSMAIRVDNVTGEVETPPFIQVKFPAGGAGSWPRLWFGTLRPPSILLNDGTPLAIELEAPDLIGPNTVAINNGDANMSQGKFSRTTFSVTSEIGIAGFFIPGLGGVHRGEFRVLARVRRTTTDSVIKMRLDEDDSPLITVPAALGPMVVDLGKARNPATKDPVSPGYGGIEVTSDANRLTLYGSSSITGRVLEIDHMFMLPATYESGYLEIGSGNEFGIIDGPNDMGYAAYDMFPGPGALRSLGSRLIGGVPMLAPGNNLIAMSIGRDSVTDSISDVYIVDVRYWPRFLAL